MDCSATFFLNNSTTLQDKVCTSFVGTWFGVEGANFTHVSLPNGAILPLLADINLKKVNSKC